MVLQSIRASQLSIPFKVAFRHASAERSATQTLWVEVRDRTGLAGHGEGCPREYVTGESLESARGFVAAHTHEWLASIGDPASLAAWAATHRASIDANPAAWCAVELALLDLFGKVQGESVEALLGLQPIAGTFHYTAVLGDASPSQFEAMLGYYRKAGFRDFKIKLSGDRARDRAKIEALTAAGIAPQSVRADANNLWGDADAAMEDLRALGFPFLALEEPLAAGDLRGMERLAEALDTRIILDESLLRSDQLASLGRGAGRWIANLRVSKVGGLLRALELVRQVRQAGLAMIVGAHVGETSLLTRAALTVASCGHDILLAQEGAFGTHLLTHDVVEPPIMFGAGGILDAAALGLATAPGLGIEISPGRIP